jgi:hypothetical protein
MGDTFSVMSLRALIIQFRFVVARTEELVTEAGDISSSVGSRYQATYSDDFMYSEVTVT